MYCKSKTAILLLRVWGIPLCVLVKIRLADNEPHSELCRGVPAVVMHLRRMWLPGSAKMDALCILQKSPCLMNIIACLLNFFTYTTDMHSR